MELSGLDHKIVCYEAIGTGFLFLDFSTEKIKPSRSSSISYLIHDIGSIADPATLCNNDFEQIYLRLFLFSFKLDLKNISVGNNSQMIRKISKRCRFEIYCKNDRHSRRYQSIIVRINYFAD